MRDINRLPNIYNKLLEAHKQFPDLRFLQFIMAFLSWHMNEYRTDGFYVEDHIFLERLNFFIKYMKGEDKNA